VRNLLAKLPERERERVRLAYWQALDDATDERDGKQRLEGLVDELDAAGYTAAAKCLAEDLDALVVHLRYPSRHRRRWRSTNLLERSLAEVKRRTKVIGRFPGETSCLTLVWAIGHRPYLLSVAVRGYSHSSTVSDNWRRAPPWACAFA
jgi:putative transposase